MGQNPPPPPHLQESHQDSNWTEPGSWNSRVPAGSKDQEGNNTDKNN